MPLPAHFTKARSIAATTAMTILAGCGLFQGDSAPVDDTPVQRSEAPAYEPPAQQRSYSSAQDGPRTTPMQAVPIASDAPDRYVVKRGDTLWDISAMFLRDPWYWPEIWQINPQVENPHLIYPGDVLSLVYIDGRPQILLERGDMRAERLSPGIRYEDLDAAITTIPYEQISAFLTRAAVLEKKEVDGLPYVLQARGDHLVSSAGNDVYARGDIRGNGSRYSFVNISEPLVDPDDNKVVGYQALYVGEGTVRRGGDPSTLLVNESMREILNGDRLIDQQVDIPLNFFPRAPARPIDGKIISVIDGVSRIGQYQVVVINRGTRDGLESGAVLTVLQAGETIRDRFSGKNRRLGGESVTLPDEPAGTVMLFKLYDRISYGLIMTADSEIRVYDSVRNPT
jgi:hypothetical protein